MTSQEFADYLNEDKNRETVTREECDLAYDNGLVIVYTSSNHKLEFDGSIRDEVDCYNGVIVYLDENGLYVSKCRDFRCPYDMLERAKCKVIITMFHCEVNPRWTCRTTIPHATFNIYEDGELWCEGIVFELSALRDG